MLVTGESCGVRGFERRLAMGPWDEHGDTLLLAHSAGRLSRLAGANGAGRKVVLTVATPSQEVAMSPRITEVGLRFGVPMTIPGQKIASRLSLPVRPGSITLVTGPSGSGKSLLLAEIAKRFPTSRILHNVQFPLDVSVLDAVAPTRPVEEALRLLTACGLGEPALWIRRFDQLSTGEQFRARLARAISLHQRHSEASPLLCDEFGAVLHRRLAKSVAFNLRKLTSRQGLALVVATSQEDLEQDLRADSIVRLGDGEPVVENCEEPSRKRSVRNVISFARQLRIERGTLRDYATFAGMHYRQGSNPGFVDKVFVCREGIGGRLLGVVVYGRPTLELRLRNQVTQGRFVRNPERLNREMRILRRLVVHPDVRGCGLGHWLVARTLPQVDTHFVECLAAMGLVNPVFEKAGMRRIGVCDPPAKLEAAVSELLSLGADPLAADFASQVRRRPSVRRLVAACVQQWYRATSHVNLSRSIKPTPTLLAQTFRQIAGSQPVYYLWACDEDNWAFIKNGTTSGT